MQALPDEPDLDRVIRLQAADGAYVRSHVPPVGVFVREVHANGKRVKGHPLNGAAVRLLGDPVFKGENGIVAEDGKEPIVPFTVEIRADKIVLTRRCPDAPEFTRSPYPGLQATAIVIAPGQIAAATGIFDIRGRLNERVARLRADMDAEAGPTRRDNLERRIRLLESRAATRFFGAMMPYFVPLGGEGKIEDSAGLLGKAPDLALPWPIDFWMGAWDPDAASGFMSGVLAIPQEDAA